MPPDPGASALVSALAGAGQTLATAESLTGGLIGAAITEVPGASAVYVGGLITYANLAKLQLTGIDEMLLDAHGAISKTTALAMAQGARRVIGADWAVAVTGVAGPDPAEGHQPGLVWLGLADPAGELVAQLRHFTGDRDQIRAATVRAAISLALTQLRRSGPQQRN